MSMNNNTTELQEVYELVRNLPAAGSGGAGIQSITFKEQDTVGNVYTVLLTDGNSYEITAPKGPKGDTGAGMFASTSEGSNGMDNDRDFVVSDVIRSDITLKPGDFILTPSGLMYRVIGADSSYYLCNLCMSLVGPAGKDGANGKDGKDGANGTSATHSWSGTTLTITSASGTSSANLKGDKGDTGATGATGPAGKDGATAAQVIAAMSKETWTFTLEDGSTVTKVVPLV